MKCGYEWRGRTRIVVKNKFGCPKCSHHKKIDSVDEINERLKIRNIKCIGFGGSATSNSKFKCNICGYEWETQASFIFYGNGCSNCSKIAPVTKEIAESRLNKIGYSLLKYGGKLDSPSLIKHNICGYIWETSVGCLINNNGKNGNTGCPFCSNRIKIKTLEDANKYLESKNDSITCLEYGGKLSTKSIFVCDRCGYIFKSTLYYASKLKSGCKKCHRPYMEDFINKFLDKHNIEYEIQKQFDGCRSPYSHRPLMFDFYLPDFNLCIETDGIQHSIPIDYFGGEEQYLKTIARDNVKDEYCKNNNINFVRIDYTQEKFIEEILIELLLL